LEDLSKFLLTYKFPSKPVDPGPEIEELLKETFRLLDVDKVLNPKSKPIKPTLYL